jgi:copper/silver efflux system protein
MLRALLKFCIHERLIVLIIAAVLIGFGVYSTQVVPIDAIPNVGENQVIVFTDWPGRSPKDVEDQITYPLSVSLLAVPGAESVRGKSMFGFSFVQVTFADGVDFYWARSRVTEQLIATSGILPDGVNPRLGPDATALGQILYYTLTPPEEGMTLAELRSLQDFVVKYELQSVPGVSEVASVGGYVRQYQIEVDPDRLRYQSVSLNQLIDAVRAANIDIGAKTVESSGMEFIVRGRGFVGEEGNPAKAVADIEETLVVSRDGVPLRVRDLGQVQIGPAFRRGAIDLNGAEAVGGVIVMQFGDNPRRVIDAVKEKMESLEPSLGGVTFNLVYDRTELINETIATLTEALQAEIIITIVVVLLFLLHLRASLVVALTLPMAVLMAFIAMRVFGVDANIMSLAGIVISIGEVIDLSIIVSENIYRHLAEWEKGQGLRAKGQGNVADGSPAAFGSQPLTDDEQEQTGKRARKKQRLDVILEGAYEVAPAVMTAVTTTIISFLPVFFLVGRDYRLFAPLAWTKTYAMVAAIIVAVLLVPALSRILLRSSRASRLTAVMSGLGGGTLAALLAGVWIRAEGAVRLARDWGLLDADAAALPWLLESGIGAGAFVLGFLAGWQISRERLRPIEENPVSRFIHWWYEPTLRLFLRFKTAFLLLPVSVVLIGAGAWLGLPTVLAPVDRMARGLGAELNDVPGWVEFKHLLPGLETDDWIALDEGSWFYMPVLYPAASLSQAMEVLQTQGTLIKQIPEVENVLGKIGRVESALDPAPVAMIETYVMLKPRDQWRPGVTERSIWDEINDVATLPGVTPASALQPIEGRVVMLQAGIRASMAIRIYGDDLDKLAEAALAIRDRLREMPQVEANTVNPDIVLGKPYVEFEVDRDTAARYNMTVRMVNETVEAAVGGADVTRTVEGRERYPIQVRYIRSLREQIDELDRLPGGDPRRRGDPAAGPGEDEHRLGTGGD